jgi:DNA-binding beta-propeller fold protein YncE
MKNPKQIINTVTFVKTSTCTVLLLLSTVAGASAQTVLAQIPIPSTSNGELAANPALSLVYSASGALFGGTLTVIDGHTLGVVTTISNTGGALNGVSIDLENDNYWTTNLYGGQILTYSSANTEIFANTVGYCPDGTSFDCKRRRIWAGAQCGGGNDPLFVFDADTFAMIAGPIGTGGVMGVIRANPVTGKLYVTEGTVSKEVNPKTFAVTTTSFGNVEAIDSVTNKLFASQGSDLQIVNGASDSICKTVTLGYTPGDIAVNNALGHLYLVYQSANAIEVRTERGKLLETFSLGTGNQPSQVAADSIRGRVYVSVVDGSGAWSVWAIEDLTSARACMRPGGP